MYKGQATPQVRKTPGTSHQTYYRADRARDRRPLKMPTTDDEYARECLAIHVERRMRPIAVTSAARVR